MQNNMGSLLKERSKESNPINNLIESKCDLEKLKKVLEEINKNTDKILTIFFGEEGKKKTDPKELNLYGFKLEDIDLVNEISEIVTKNSKDFMEIGIFKDIEEEINNIMDLCYEKENIRNLKSFNIESYFNEYLEKNILYTCEEQFDELPEKVSEIVLDIEEALIDYAKKDIIKLLNSLHSIKEKIRHTLVVINDSQNID